MDKIYNDKDQVGVAVSYGYGAGWSTWNNVSPMDARYNQLILDENWEEAEKLADTEGQYRGGLRDCIIRWLDKGTRFEISEYDGSEELLVVDNLTYTA